VVKLRILRWLGHLFRMQELNQREKENEKERE
jgi:hypothetical protein